MKGSEEDEVEYTADDARDDEVDRLIRERREVAMEKPDTKREQDRAWEEGSSVKGACVECGQDVGVHARVNGEAGVVLICPRSTFTPYGR